MGTVVQGLSDGELNALGAHTDKHLAVTASHTDCTSCRRLQQDGIHRKTNQRQIERAEDPPISPHDKAAIGAHHHFTQND